MKVMVDKGDNLTWLIEYTSMDERDGMRFVEMPDDIWEAYKRHINACHVWNRYLNALHDEQEKTKRVRTASVA